MSTPTLSGSVAHSFRVATGLIWIDMKQGLRKHMSGTTRRDKFLKSGGLFLGLLFLAGLHLAAFSLVTYTGVSPSDDRQSLFAGLSTSLWCFLLFVMISGGLVRALVVLHEQDDSGLLLSSPVSPRAILAARLFGNALQSCLVDGFIIVPYINVRALVFGQLNFLWGYLLWFMLAIVVTCIDGLFSFGMIRWMGLRRARLFSQAVPFILIFGVTFFAGSLSVSVAEMDVGSTPHMPPVMQEKFIALAHTPLVWLAWAGAGNLRALLAIAVFTIALAWLTLRLTERSFVEGTQNLAENESAAKPGSADGPFRAGLLRLEIRKNLRLIVRTPMMVVQCIAQVLTPVGIAFVLGRADPTRGVAFFMIFVAGVLAGIFTIAAGTVEECDDLLRMSPHGTFLFRLGKMLSGCLWPLGLTLLIALGLAVAGAWLQAMGVLLAGMPLAIASSIVGETFAKPVRTGTRPKLLSDPIMMIPLLGMQIASGCVAGIAVFTASFSLQFLLLGLLASYLVMVLVIGLAQLRKPLLGNF
jgi:ABC-2 type transport system permease protein